MRTCGATPGGPSLDGIDLSKQTVIQGQILRDGSSDSVPNGAAVTNGHVRLLDADGEPQRFRPIVKVSSASSQLLVPGLL